MLALVGTLGSASAASVAPVSGLGNPSCADGLRLEPVASGTYHGGLITIVVTGSTFSFTTDGTLIGAIVVKGGPGYNLYTYPDPGVTSDSGLSAPTNAKNGRPYGLSHICIFGDDKKTPDPK